MAEELFALASKSRQRNSTITGTGFSQDLHTTTDTNIAGYSELVCLFVCFLGVTTHCGFTFHSPIAGFSLLVFEVS
jgi:hypothetical protein